MVTMKEALAKANIPMTPEEEWKDQERRKWKHRGRTVLERPKEEVKLHKLSEEPFERKKYQSDPTPDLIEIPAALDKKQLFDLVESCNEDSYIIWCNNTMQTWLAPTQLCLDQNFIYRYDLDIVKYSDPDSVWDFYESRGHVVNPGMCSCKVCYILDSPAEESYEVYYNSNYPLLKYGKTTPNGMFIHKCRDRFYRDMKIMELDKLYDESSATRAAEMTKKELTAKEAIVISDGCFMRNVCTSAYYYLDNVSLIKMTQGIIPTEPDQAVLISEIAGATSALQMCRIKGKKKITYYYDNTSIMNVFRNRKMEYVQEIVEYKQLVEEMTQEGYDIKFVELHPKTGEDREDTNKALMYFHNYCDKECQDMARIFSKDYRSIAISDDSEGKTFKQVKKEFAPKGRPKNGGNGNKGVQNNSANGNNRWGRKM